MANLPKDIIVDILIKLPIKSLVRFKCVCNQWCSLISDPSFVKLHLNKEDRQTLLLVGSVNNLFSIDYESYVSNNGPVEAKKVELPMPMKFVDTVGCCDGLLCLDINRDSIVLSNPSTKEFRELPSPGSYPRGPFFYGFGYDSSIDDYKVIKGFKDEINILALKTNTWRRIQNFDYPVYDYNEIGEFVNGAIHWIASRYSNYSRDEFKIVGLDLVEEKLFEVPQPDHNNICPSHGLAVLGGCLCLRRLVDTNYEIWLMKEYGVGDSWTKLISYPWLELSNPILVPHCIMSNGEILIWTDYKKLFIYNLDERKFKGFVVCNDPRFWWNSWSYKESLVSPNMNLISPNQSLLSQNKGDVI